MIDDFKIFFHHHPHGFTIEFFLWIYAILSLLCNSSTHTQPKNIKMHIWLCVKTFVLMWVIDSTVPAQCLALILSNAIKDFEVDSIADICTHPNLISKLLQASSFKLQERQQLSWDLRKRWVSAQRSSSATSKMHASSIRAKRASPFPFQLYHQQFSDVSTLLESRLCYKKVKQNCFPHPFPRLFLYQLSFLLSHILFFPNMQVSSSNLDFEYT